MNLDPRHLENSLKMLIVDDDPTTRLMLATLGTRLGHSVVLAEGGQSAHNAYAAEQPDIVLMDMLMPGMSGHQTMLKIRTLAGQRWVPILFVAVVGEVGTHVRALAEGADDYLVKPVHGDVLRAKLEVTRRTINLQREVEVKNRELERFRDDAENEMRVAKHLLDRLAHNDTLSDPMLEHWILPVANFSGNLVAAARYIAVRVETLAQGADSNSIAAENISEEARRMLALAADLEGLAAQFKLAGQSAHTA